MKRGIATFTLDHGRCPPWLFERMVKLGREMSRVIVEEYGSNEFIARLGDPVWFQSLGTVLAFDWNASGLTTILTAALKEAIRGRERELGIFIAGGKGKTSRKTPEQIRQWGSILGLPDGQVANLEYNSKISAKVDSALIQDGFQLYHHCFFFAVSKKPRPERTKRVEGYSPSTSSGLDDSTNISWTVIQQGMNTAAGSARRYHWHSKKVKDLIVEPHSGIASQMKQASVLNMTAKGSRGSRQLSVEVLNNSYNNLLGDLQLLDKHVGPYSQMIKLKQNKDQLTLANLDRVEFSHHPVEAENFSRSRYLQKILHQLNEQKPKSYETLVATPGVGPKTIRALSLVGEVVYGAKPSYRDPARYSFAHGGKDATPYPVDRSTYDQTIETMREIVGKTRLTYQDKSKALERLTP